MGASLQNGAQRCVPKGPIRKPVQTDTNEGNNRGREGLRASQPSPPKRTTPVPVCRADA